MHGFKDCAATSVCIGMTHVSRQNSVDPNLYTRTIKKLGCGMENKTTKDRFKDCAAASVCLGMTRVSRQNSVDPNLYTRKVLCKN